MPIGRPIIKGGRRKPVTVLLKPKIHKLTFDAAAKSEVSVSQFIAMLVNDYFLSEAREKVG